MDYEQPGRSYDVHDSCRDEGAFTSSRVKSVFVQYLALTKPGIIFGNMVTALGGFLLASRLHVDLFLLLQMMIGLSCVIAAGCVCNNYIDRDIDAQMERTRRRSFVTGTVSIPGAFLLACLLSVVGFSLLFFITPLCSLLAFVGFFIYVVVYGWMKRVSEYATLVGSIAGAIPPVVGYCSVVHAVDTAAMLIFSLVVLWQMPHFYAIAMYRLKDYETAKIPVLPITQGELCTKVHMCSYVVAFTYIAVWTTWYAGMSVGYVVLSFLLGGIWTVIAVRGFFVVDSINWARRMFRFSLIVIMAQCFVFAF